MSEAPRKEIPLPKGDDDFEDLVLALFRVVWQDPGAKLHGRSGQRQDGVDLYGEDRFGGSGLNGVQCKQHGSATLLRDKDLVAELREEVEKAKGFQPPLQRFIFATTARRSVTLQQEARDLTELHRQDGLFAVDVLAREDIEDLLRRHSDVLDWYLDERTKVHGPLLDIGRLPIPGPHFVGRDAELARLDAAWEAPAIHVLTLVAFGGVGKSALVARWLDRMAADGWRGAARVLDWSFYSQGSKDQNTSAEPFIDYALRFFGDPDPKAGSLHDRGARPGLAQSAEQLDRAVDGLRRAGTEHNLPWGLLARAALLRLCSDFSGAAADLTEALEIAERGPMRLHECDAHLEWARLCRDQGDLAAARRHVARARELVNETGYGRREREVGWLEGTVG